ncbi:CDP-alcohol phosphatidyltransferase family protein [Methanocella sp. MCL-LM]|uniref:CDP-alcohol phosphatidyltransferase family protein n=1 Tax=Methanocella sp. MCL-LM TaxID=3412035 RepID=UPI003C786EBB
MSLLYTFKPLKDRALIPISRILHRAGVTPNMVTSAGLLTSVIGGLLAASGHLYSGIAVFIFGASLDAVDGSLARSWGECTEFGRYFDSTCDRLSELAFVVGAIVGGASAAAIIVITGSYILLASRIFNHRRGLNSDAAMFGRPERLALLIAGMLAPAPYDLALFATAGLLCLISSGQALAAGLRSSRDQDRGRSAGPVVR